ncbi:hypothetical protein Aph01nite_19780 [Acrocarpospora phusangensis]|uniref:OmpR/PhoB-type domain-containing protein n=1 Tax=Acrocarpospora phusangensis TaxID=1070424 RepID=A0A919QA71_9ACTN|nr:winged helix-turn-helix domain-containing protein [Acrocarpospora phusangensis]GIH23668.1 hypothetical protein Aph01nite_19780 [Acrocarpospora phusangensis]
MATQRTENPGPGLWLGLVGDFRVYRDGVPVHGPKVGSLKARTLLTLLAVRWAQLVPLELVVEAVWGGQAPRQPGENVATLVSRVRAVLGSEVIEGSRIGGYRLGEGVRVDLAEAAAFVGQAEAYLSGGQPGAAVAAAVRGLGLLDGAVLGGEEAEWARPARVLHAQLLRRARRAHAEAAPRAVADHP